MFDPSKPLRIGFELMQLGKSPVASIDKAGICSSCNLAAYDVLVCGGCYNTIPTQEEAKEGPYYCSALCFAEGMRDHCDQCTAGEVDELPNTPINIYGWYIAVKDIKNRPGFYKRALLVPPTNRKIFHECPAALSHIPPMYKTILEEYRAQQLNDGDSKEWIQNDITPGKSGCFKQVYLSLMGQNLPVSSQYPKTMALLKQLPISMATISVLDNDTRVAWHAGFRKYSEYIVRCHLPLLVPPAIPSSSRLPDLKPGKETIAFDVQGNVREWKEGELFMFDDCEIHEAYNYTNQTRIMLIFDIIRPRSFPYLANKWESPAYKTAFDVTAPYADLLPGMTSARQREYWMELLKVQW